MRLDTPVAAAWPHHPHAASRPGNANASSTTFEAEKRAAWQRAGHQRDQPAPWRDLGATVAPLTIARQDVDGGVAALVLEAIASEATLSEGGVEVGLCDVVAVTSASRPRRFATHREGRSPETRHET
jgi:hypothetical protein